MDLNQNNFPVLYYKLKLIISKDLFPFISDRNFLEIKNLSKGEYILTHLKIPDYVGNSIIFEHLYLLFFFLPSQHNTFGLK